MVDSASDSPSEGPVVRLFLRPGFLSCTSDSFGIQLHNENYLIHPIKREKYLFYL